MDELRLPNLILAFDGRVIEIFQHSARGGGQRYHVAHLQAGEVIEGRKDARLSLTFSSGRVLISFPGDAVGQMQGFLGRILAQRTLGA